MSCCKVGCEAPQTNFPAGVDKLLAQELNCGKAVPISGQTAAHPPAPARPVQAAGSAGVSRSRAAFLNSTAKSATRALFARLAGTPGADRKSGGTRSDCSRQS